MKKVRLIVDTSSIFRPLAAKAGGGGKLNYTALHDYAKDFGELSATAFVSELRDEANRFIRALKGIGYTVITKSPRVYIRDGIRHVSTANMFDVDIAIDLIEGTDTELYVVVTLSTFLLPALRIVRQRGQQVLLMCTGVPEEFRDFSAIEIPASMLL